MGSSMCSNFFVYWATPWRSLHRPCLFNSDNVLVRVYAYMRLTLLLSLSINQSCLPFLWQESEWDTHLPLVWDCFKPTIISFVQCSPFHFPRTIFGCISLSIFSATVTYVCLFIFKFEIYYSPQSCFYIAMPDLTLPSCLTCYPNSWVFFLFFCLFSVP